MFIVGIDGRVIEEGDEHDLGIPNQDDYELLDERYMVKTKPKGRKKRSGRQVYEVVGIAFGEVVGLIREELSRSQGV
ncbi:hypothetical protein AOL_s00193g171 [Orbilia oligospora ATCC 24927]|uniref:Uncharacterized protein n=2 Tax=Orbilia oligospora TaxID=2813651 RepID=G1XRH2_ARTOA|nr:hypothetical protein AOL_s00193g171 [Orbilia oligospora ATCC 24927]EGX44259.1 hypothetical protein AOL_s00193g171 [Orbilia oligospora ATCC 24927]